MPAIRPPALTLTGRRSRTIAGVAAIGAGAAMACAPFGKTESDPRPSIGAGGRGPDAGAAGLEASIGDDASAVDAGSPDCVDLAKPGHGFVLQGNAVATPQGVLLEMGSTEATIRRDFVVDHDITRSAVVIDATITIGTEAWATTGQNYVDLLAQYHGPGVTYQANDTGTVAMTATSAGVDLLVWNGVGGYDPLYSRPLAVDAGTIELTTTFGRSGNVVVRAGATAISHPEVETSVVASRQFKLIIGGFRVGGTPSITIEVSRVCVSIE